MLGCTVEQQPEQVHHLWRLGRARAYSMGYCLIVTHEDDTLLGPQVNPSGRCYHNWEKFFPLDSVVLLVFGPAALKPVPCPMVPELSV